MKRYDPNEVRFSKQGTDLRPSDISNFIGWGLFIAAAPIAVALSPFVRNLENDGYTSRDKKE